MDADRSVTVTIELGRATEPIRGELTNSSGDTIPFSGWMGLIAAVEAARSAAPTEPVRPA